MRRLLFFCVSVLLWASAASAQVIPPGVQTVTANGQCVTWNIPQGVSSMTFQMTGNLSGTITWYGNAWQTFYVILATNVADGTTASTATANGQYAVANVGLTQVRACITAYVSGGSNISLVRGYASSVRGGGSGSVTFPLLASASDCAAPSYSFAGDTDTGLSKLVEGRPTICANGVSIATLTSSGGFIGKAGFFHNNVIGWSMGSGLNTGPADYEISAQTGYGMISIPTFKVTSDDVSHLSGIRTWVAGYADTSRTFQSLRGLWVSAANLDANASPTLAYGIVVDAPGVGSTQISVAAEVPAGNGSGLYLPQAAGTESSAGNAIYMSPTWNNVANTAVAVDMNVTDTASAAASMVQRWRVNVASVGYLSKLGEFGAKSLAIGTNYNAFTVNTSGTLTALNVIITGNQSYRFAGQTIMQTQGDGTLQLVQSNASGFSRLILGTADDVGGSIYNEAVGGKFQGFRVAQGDGGNVLFADLGAATNGTMVYCADCLIQATCAGSGTGAIAKRLNSAWVCN